MIVNRITIAAFSTPFEAHLARGRLEAEGVTAWVVHEHHVAANWMLSNALGGVKVQVDERDAARAAAILDAVDAGEFETALEAAAPDAAPIERAACPACGSREFSSGPSRPMVWLALLSFGLAEVIFPLRHGRHRCAHCGTRWTD
ncbi:putative signal transducing protein [Crenobacter cavernae]|uniref:DUF2007 domain-containing protein n=1 Tax=Crenobacter cavernae TaxID=2290923 RepID=A0ABY0FGF5_9NEIS|nr:DUF2007 domain-containing protein [Crenobacter cavernae]RXZ44255.1 DUF2007 domain-containing protein [Crenobacter cavernae]